MAQVVEDREKSNFPRDLLNRFMNHQHFPMHLVKQEHHHDNDDDAAEEEEIELSLGLSMNGRFGVDPSAKKIKRTTSIPEFVKPVRRGGEEEEEEDVGYPMPVMPRAPLVRTCSLPTETEEEWRKRKELQSLRRMEARRKRSEKQRNLKAIREQQQQQRREREIVEGGNYNLVEQAAGNEFGGGLGRTTSLSTRVGGLGLNDKCGGLPPPSPSCGGGSFGGSSSPGISESESQQVQGLKAMDASRSPIGASSLPSSEHKSPATSGPGIAENSSRFAAMAVRHESANRHSPPENKTKDIVRNLLEDMPCVSTKGDGPDGRRIEGFLYRYGKGEEVRIVCVCHGSFLTPAEFVKHAGGGDVANPLKHIVVSSSC